MDYEQRYKEALDEAKAIHKAIKQDLKPIIEQIFPELKESRTEKPNGGIVSEDFNEGNGFYKVNLAYLSKEQVEEIENLVKKWNPKSEDEVDNANKVVQKFYKGDFIKHNNSDIIYKVFSIDNDFYFLKNVETDEITGKFERFNLEQNFHRWSIKDAKDGDILCTYECDEPKIVFVLKGTPKKPYVLSYYCYYNIMYPYFEPDSKTGCLTPNTEDLKPASKEQRYTLFEKMKLKGYRWDEDKKELIRFERFVSRKESDFAFKEDENGVIKFVHKKSKV